MDLTAKIEIFRGAIALFLANQLREKITQSTKKLDELRAAQKEEAKTITEQEIKLYELEEDLGRLQTRIRDAKTFEEDFEKLSRLQGVRKVLADDYRVTIETKRLFQIIPPMGTPYDIGQFTISIYLTAESFDIMHGIIFSPGPYKGRFIHKNSRPGAVCYGNTDAAIGNDVLQLFSDLAIPDLTALLLSFLQRDEVVPEARPEGDIKGSPAYSEKPEDSYELEKERQDNKAAYVSLLRRVTLKRSAAELNKKNEGAQLSLKKQLEALLSRRETIKQIETKIKMLEPLFGQIPERAERYAKFLVRHAKDAQYDQGGDLVIHFNFENLELRLRLHPSGHPKVFGVPKYHRLAKIVEQNGQLMAVDQNAHGRLVRLGCTGDLPGLMDQLNEILMKGG